MFLFISNPTILLFLKYILFKVIHSCPVEQPNDNIVFGYLIIFAHSININGYLL